MTIESRTTLRNRIVDAVRVDGVQNVMLRTENALSLLDYADALDESNVLITNLVTALTEARKALQTDYAEPGPRGMAAIHRTINTIAKIDQALAPVTFNGNSPMYGDTRQVCVRVNDIEVPPYAWHYLMLPPADVDEARYGHTIYFRPLIRIQQRRAPGGG